MNIDYESPANLLALHGMKFDAKRSPELCAYDLDNPVMAYYCIEEEEGGSSIYVANSSDLSPILLGKRGMVRKSADAAKIVKALAKGVITQAHVVISAQRDEAASYAEVVLYARNHARSQSVKDYRKRLKENAFPTDPALRWDFLVNLANNDPDGFGKALHYVGIFADSLFQTPPNPMGKGETEDILRGYFISTHNKVLNGSGQF